MLKMQKQLYMLLFPHAWITATAFFCVFTKNFDTIADCSEISCEAFNWIEEV